MKIGQSFRSRSIRFKLLFYFLSLILFLTLMLGVFNSRTYTRFIESQTTAHITQTISQVNKNIEYTINSAEHIMRYLSEQPEVLAFLSSQSGGAEPDTKAILAQLQSFTRINAEIAGLIIVSHSNDSLSNEMFPLSRDPLTQESWYQTALAEPDRLHLFSNPIGRNIRVTHRYGTDEVVSLALAVRDPIDSSIIGVIVVDLVLDFIRQATDDVTFGESGFLFVVDTNGQVVYAPVNSTVYRVNTAWLDTGSSGSLIRTINNNDFEILFSESQYTHWKTVGVFSLPEVLTIVSSTERFTIVISLLTLAFAVMAAYFFTASIDRPLRKLRSLMKQAEEGNLNVAFNSRYNDEIGQLGKSFNNMIAEIRGLISLVYTEQKSKREAELKTLQAQIKPHFLYNTLDTIQWLAQQHGAADIVEIVGALTTLFRIGISKGREMISLHDELDHIRSYLVIQKSRYEDKIAYAIDADTALLNLRVVKLILQPLVENAIYHGIKERRGNGMIRISVSRDGPVLLLAVADDGVGIPPARLAQLQTALHTGAAGQDGIGYGIFNVNERIRLTYGPEYGLSIDSELGLGTTVTIRHPVIERS